MCLWRCAHTPTPDRAHHCICTLPERPLRLQANINVITHLSPCKPAIITHSANVTLTEYTALYRDIHRPYII